MDMGGLVEGLLLALCGVWVGSTVVGILIGSLTRLPVIAFLCGAVVAGLIAFAADSFFFGSQQVWEHDLGLCVVPPGFLAGIGAEALVARWRWRGRRASFPIAPETERAARERFHLPGPPGDTTAIRPGDGSVRDEAEG